jgi:hypothetical protein
MRSFATAAALCAAVLTLAPAARADDVPQPVSRTVVEPPAQPAEALAPSPAPLRARSEVGFTVRAGAAETDRFLLGGSFGAASGPFMVGVSADGTFDVHGSRDTTRHSDGWRDWCAIRADGRCTNRADLALAGYLGVRHKTGPVFGGARLRLELAGELGWQWSYVDERLSDGAGGHLWSDATRAFPIAGLRAQVGLTVFRNATFGIGGYARQGLQGRVCVNTEGGCTKVGGTTGGVYFFGGGDWGILGG